jgi:signal transduction histidine kinase
MELEDGERQEINKGIVENTGRITDLVNKMLELSDAKSHTVIKRTDEIPAIQIAVEATDASGISHAKHLDYDMQISPEAEMILLTTNRRAATRALSLLLDNACKFTKMADQQANASHEAEVSDKKKAVLRLQVADGMLQFIVEDTGIGIPPSEAERTTRVRVLGLPWHVRWCSA